MRKKTSIFLAILGLITLIFLLNKVDDYFIDNQPVAKSGNQKGDQERENPPYAFFQAGELFTENDWGNINIDEIQGITQNKDYWFISTQWELYKISKQDPSNISAHIHLISLQREFSNGWYRHFGGITYHNGLIYIATTGRRHALTTEKAAPILIVVNENLEFVKYGIFPPDAQKGAAWVEHNPKTNTLFSSNGPRELTEYKIDFNNKDTLKLLDRYPMVYTNVQFNEAEWDDVVTQGGSFSSSGLLFFVLDTKHANNSPYTGIHMFAKNGNQYKEENVVGINNKGEDVSFINIKYKGNKSDQRLWELEDTSICEENGYEVLYHIQLFNSTPDRARILRYRLYYPKT